jgi:phage protein D
MTSVRSPRLRVLADGAEVPGALSAEICSNNCFGADLWRARLALSAEPEGLAAWDGRTQALIELQMSLGGEWVILVSGRIDSLSADAIAGLVTIEGRDLSAGLIEARTRESFANQTASDIASLLAGRHQLAAKVTPTSTPIGRYYGANHDRVTLDRYSRASTEWDLLVWLAQQEAFDVFVSGTTLFFQPATTQPAPAMALHAVPAEGAPANVSQLRVQRAMTLAGDVEVQVKSWNSQTQTSCSQIAQRSGTGGAARSYVFIRPNLSTNGAMSLAQNKLAALTQHGYVLTATMPGELTLTPRDVVSLIGTGSSFDQNYTIDEIRRGFDARRGFIQTLRARSAGGS